jgi:hypothetical protein
MNKSENIGALAKALAAVQSQLKPAIKDTANSFLKSKYADLNSVWDSCRDLLADNDLAVTQLNDVSETGVIVETVLMHSSGEWISGRMYLPLTKHDAQGVGSALTYGRRYGLAAIIGIIADDDDDGQAASQPKQQQQNRPKQNEKVVQITKAVDLVDRIEKAKAKIQEFGAIVELQKPNETNEEYFESLTAQYKRLKEIADGK